MGIFDWLKSNEEKTQDAVRAAIDDNNPAHEALMIKYRHLVEDECALSEFPDNKVEEVTQRLQQFVGEDGKFDWDKLKSSAYPRGINELQKNNAKKLQDFCDKIEQGVKGEKFNYDNPQDWSQKFVPDLHLEDEANKLYKHVEDECFSIGHPEIADEVYKKYILEAANLLINRIPESVVKVTLL